MEKDKYIFNLNKLLEEVKINPDAVMFPENPGIPGDEDNKWVPEIKILTFLGCHEEWCEMHGRGLNESLTLAEFAEVLNKAITISMIDLLISEGKLRVVIGKDGTQYYEKTGKL